MSGSSQATMQPSKQTTRDEWSFRRQVGEGEGKWLDRAKMDGADLHLSSERM